MSCGARESSGSLFSSISSKIDTAENGCHKKMTTDTIIVPLHTERVDAGVMTVPMMTKHYVTEPVILAFEASGDQASAAVLTADGRQSVHHHMARHGHAAVITGLAELVLQDCAIDASGITHVVAGCGPGSFTGIRVALAAAKGFQIASNAVPVGLSCLAVMAHTATKDPATAGLAGHDAQAVLASADTRRGSFFCQAFDANGAALGDILDVDPTRETDDLS
jgi:tRNA threonylcarbamoyl adenosine modification protein YeaZ